METRDTPSLIDVINALNRRGVRYLLVGGQAVNQYGSSILTKDTDFWVAPSYRKEVWTTLTREFQFDGPQETETEKPISRFFLDWQIVDILSFSRATNLEGQVLDFDTCFARATKFSDPDGSFYVYVPSIPDLIALKKMRPLTAKDLEDLRYLEQAQRLREAQA